ncbi:MAG: FAD-binding oxidoreductase, partial [Chloroflexota bacterium]|nr:FAD-binding oxidoreductase [Chloroflexota bacterium]
MTVSLWQDTASWPGEVEHERIVADIAIVGGGIVGATLATFLAGAGRNVVVLEAGIIAGGASGRNAGHCIAGLRNSYHHAVERLGREGARNLRTQMLDNREMVRDFCDRLNVPYERNGSQYLGIDAAEGAELRACAEAFQADGFEVEFSEADPLERGFIGRLYQPDDLALQPYLLVSRLMASSGARVLENCEVCAIEQAGDIVTLRGRRATVECRQAILATNAYSRNLHDYFRDKVFPTRAQMYATEPSVEPRLIAMPTGTDDGNAYFRQLPDGRFLIGGHRDRFVDAEVGYGDETTPQLQASMQAWVAERFPEIATLAVTHRWAGIMGFTADAMPLIGRLPDMPSVYFAVGFTGSGMSYG